MEAWEINPFSQEMDKLKLAETKQKDIISDIKKVNIWTELESDQIILKTEFGQGHLQSYSREGINLILAEEFVKGSRINIILDSRDGRLSQLLRNQGIDILALEVSWSYKDGNRYMHGTRFSGIDKDKITIIVNLIKQLDSVSESEVAS